MSNPAKNADYTSDEEEEEESESEEEEQPKAGKGKEDAKLQDSPEEEEESSEQEEDSETDNDENDAQRYTTMRREGNSAGGAKAGNSNNPVGKRGRDDDGKDEEPASKKSKDSKGDKGRATLKPASPSRSNKSDHTGKGGKAPVSKSKSEKVKSGEREETTKAAAATKKRKASPPLVNGSSKQKAENGEKNSPVKPKTTPFMWTSNLETALATMLWNDKKHGRPIPKGKKDDAYWTKLVKELGSEGVVISETQLSEKVRRMKTKWRAYKGKEAENPWKSAHEKTLYGIWESIWGNGTGVVKQPAHPGTPLRPNEDEDEESSEEEKEVPPAPAVRGSKAVTLPSRKEQLSESESEEEEEEVPKKVGGSHEGTSKEGTAFSPTAVVSPFVSKPRLEYTPVVPKDKKKGSRRGDDASIAEQSGGEGSADDEEGDGQTSAAVLELLSSLKKESFGILHEVRASCLDALNNIRKQTTTVMDDMKDVNSRLGVSMPSSGMWRMNGGTVPSLDRGLLEDFMTNTLRAGVNGANGSVAAELKTHWRQLRVEEMDLLEKRIQLTLKQLQLARKEFDEQDE